MIGYAYVECLLYDVQSLKGKRSIIKQVTNQITKKFNVSMTEIDFHDTWQRSAFGIAVVSTDKVMAERVLQQAVETIDSRTDLDTTIIEYEWL
ncbi:uncharacterized protein YlxP (DUF503 family) [Alkalibacillus filiformis]|uniref:Uncharacterized protein YlxP (DUF503 family) n=1 Tax=Alkalibacillus filiformis TaxID=200990 RepID=A0ABU0DQR4_9BACI|nr:DUF503 family protein [Alkalibacillus filiformis]MDQ0350666.1 uncharacterized protein YlxP (DUF503 family) [Alkalibacillus filiformis]